MENNNIWHIPPQGSTIERVIINTLNFVTDIVYKTIVKPNGEKLDKNVNDTRALENQISEDNDTILDLMYENDLLKDQVSEDNDAILDIDFRVSQLEDKEA